MGHGKGIDDAGSDSTSGPWGAEDMQRKWTTAMRKPEQETFRGVLGEPPRASSGSATGAEAVAWSTETAFHLSSLPEEFP